MIYKNEFSLVHVEKVFKIFSNFQLFSILSETPGGHSRSID